MSTTAEQYEDVSHSQECQLRYMPKEEAAAKDYGCTCGLRQKAEER